MIVYSGTKRTFQNDVVNGRIAREIDSLFRQMGIGRESIQEFNSWKNSLPQMAVIMSDERIDKDVKIAIEYQGKQHYQVVSKFGGSRGFHQQQFNDTQKRRFCKKYNLKLIEIPYTEENLIDYDYIMRKAGY